jgi:hypothetical protein
VVHSSRLCLSASFPWSANKNVWLSLDCYKQGQGELRGKPHRSNRCGDFAAYEDLHLRRREGSSISVKLYDEWQRLMLVYRVAQPCPREIWITVDGKSKRKKVDLGFAWKRCSKELRGQGEFLDKDALFASMGFPLMILLGRLPPTQTKGIPGFQRKTPVAQMHFASELPLSEGDHSIDMDGLMMITQANPGSTGKRMGKLLKNVTLKWLNLAHGR